MGVAFLWGTASMQGSKLPFIVTESSFTIRAYFLFPFLLTILLWLIFLHKWAETGKTGFQMKLGNVKNKKIILKKYLFALTGSFLFASFIAWFSVNTSAFIANLVANKPYIETYKVFGTKGVSNLTEVELQNLSNKETAYIRLKYDAFGKGIWDYGAIVKIEGRTSIFGTIAEKATRLN